LQFQTLTTAARSATKDQPRILALELLDPGKPAGRTGVIAMGNMHDI